MREAMIRERLLAARGFVFDMDGTLVLGDRPSLEPTGAGSDWTDERGTSEEGRRNLKGARRRAGQQSCVLRRGPVSDPR
jgi:hypothetical protein